MEDNSLVHAGLSWIQAVDGTTSPGWNPEIVRWELGEGRHRKRARRGKKEVGSFESDAIEECWDRWRAKVGDHLARVSERELAAITEEVEWRGCSETADKGWATLEVEGTEGEVWDDEGEGQSDERVGCYGWSYWSGECKRWRTREAQSLGEQSSWETSSAWRASVEKCSALKTDSRSQSSSRVLEVCLATERQEKAGKATSGEPS